MLKFRHGAAAPTVSPYDRRGQYRSPMTRPEFHRGRRPGNAGHTYPVEVLTPEEVYALMDQCGRGSAGIRNRALIMILWRCGLRCSEALALFPKDVDLDRGIVTVLHGKGDKRRVVKIDPAAAAVCERWLARRRQLGLAGRHPYFCVITKQQSFGQALHSSHVRHTLHRLATQAGIEKRVHPHGLRHTYAAHLADQGVPLQVIQHMLGHSNIAITNRYINHVNPARMLEQMELVTWPEPPDRRSSGAARPPGPSRAAA